MRSLLLVCCTTQPSLLLPRTEWSTVINRLGHSTKTNERSRQNKEQHQAGPHPGLERWSGFPAVHCVYWVLFLDGDY
jgi:hypothetical protein